MNARDKTPLRAQIADRLAARTLSTEEAAAALLSGEEWRPA